MPEGFTSPPLPENSVLQEARNALANAREALRDAGERRDGAVSLARLRQEYEAQHDVLAAAKALYPFLIQRASWQAGMMEGNEDLTLSAETVAQAAKNEGLTPDRLLGLLVEERSPLLSLLGKALDIGENMTASLIRKFNQQEQASFVQNVIFSAPEGFIDTSSILNPSSYTHTPEPRVYGATYESTRHHGRDFGS